MHTVNTKEIENFAKDSSKWWDEQGPFRPLHRLNPVRLSYFKDQICTYFDRDRMIFKPYTGLSILDIGCGGGLVCEPMARLGADVTGIDADKNAIAVADEHAKNGGLDVRYICGSSDDLVASKKQYDIVLALEIIEHVATPQKFVDDCLALCKPNGLVIFSTINRNAKSFALAKIAAEYILGWVPRGTHDWNKFVKPSELSRMVRDAGGKTSNTQGMTYNPILDEFKQNPHDVDVNYFMAVSKG